MEYGVIGKKLGHTFSPAIHKMLGDYDYGVKEIPPEEIKEFFKTRDFKGLNVTIPYKKDAYALCDKVSDFAAALGSVNTVVKRPDGSLFGDNTDGYGFAYMLKYAGITVKGKQCLVIGNGGASVTVQAVLKEQGASEIVVFDIGDNTPENQAKYFRSAQIVVNASPVGMYPACDASPLPLQLFTNLSGVVDLVYNPCYTRLIQTAKKKGVPCSSGLPMLVAQAVRAYEIFFDTKAAEGTIENILNTMYNDTLNIVLVGMPGCGKSTVGRYLAQDTGKELIDTDALIVKKAGKSIPEIFAESGETGFRKIESEVLEEVSKLSGKIIATGGGIVTIPENIPRLVQNGKVVFINRSLNELATDGRPLSKPDNMKKMLRIRLPLYRSVCDLEIPFLSSRQVADRILEEFSSVKGEHPEESAKMPQASDDCRKILVINGPNLNMLGIREPDIYGRQTYADLVNFCQDAGKNLGFAVETYQSNHEGDLVDKIQEAFGKIDGIVINPAAYTHTSVAILDAVKAVAIPTVEVHLSDVASREDFRQISYIRKAAIATVTGMGFEGYRKAMEILKDHLENHD